MYVITGATGNLGRHVVNLLLSEVDASSIKILVRSPEKAADLAAEGVTVVKADYDTPETLSAALESGDKLLLISSSEVGKRVAQHGNVVEAAKNAGVASIAYTSLLNADTSYSSLAGEHLATEKLIKDSGLSYTLLRNGWYIENYTENFGGALGQGAFYGAAGDGQIAAASRKDFAAAAVAVLTGTGHEGKVYELGGDTSFTMTELAALVSEITGKDLPYTDLPEAAFQGALEGAGLPQPVAVMLATSDTAISKGHLDTDSTDLHDLIGRATATLPELAKPALAAL